MNFTYVHFTDGVFGGLGACRGEEPLRCMTPCATHASAGSRQQARRLLHCAGLLRFSTRTWPTEPPAFHLRRRRFDTAAARHGTSLCQSKRCSSGQEALDCCRRPTSPRGSSRLQGPSAVGNRAMLLKLLAHHQAGRSRVPRGRHCANQPTCLIYL